MEIFIAWPIPIQKVKYYIGPDIHNPQYVFFVKNPYIYGYREILFYTYVSGLSSFFLILSPTSGGHISETKDWMKKCSLTRFPSGIFILVYHHKYHIRSLFAEIRAVDFPWCDTDVHSLQILGEGKFKNINWNIYVNIYPCPSMG